MEILALSIAFICFMLMSFFFIMILIYQKRNRELTSRIKNTPVVKCPKCGYMFAAGYSGQKYEVRLTVGDKTSVHGWANEPNGGVIAERAAEVPGGTKIEVFPVGGKKPVYSMSKKPKTQNIHKAGEAADNLKNGKIIHHDFSRKKVGDNPEPPKVNPLEPEFSDLKINNLVKLPGESAIDKVPEYIKNQKLFFDNYTKSTMLMGDWSGETWIFYKHPAGNWVSLRKANEDDIDKVNKLFTIKKDG